MPGCVKARRAEDQAQFNVIDEQDEAFMNAAAVAAAIADSQRRICELIDSKAGTSAITYRSPNKAEGIRQDRVRESPDTDRFSIAKHVEERPPKQGDPG